MKLPGSESRVPHLTRSKHSGDSEIEKILSDPALNRPIDAYDFVTGLEPSPSGLLCPEENLLSIGSRKRARYALLLANSEECALMRANPSIDVNDKAISHHIPIQKAPFMIYHDPERYLRARNHHEFDPSGPDLFSSYQRASNLFGLEVFDKNSCSNVGIDEDEFPDPCFLEYLLFIASSKAESDKYSLLKGHFDESALIAIAILIEELLMDFLRKWSSNGHPLDWDTLNWSTKMVESDINNTFSCQWKNHPSFPALSSYLAKYELSEAKERTKEWNALCQERENHLQSYLRSILYAFYTPYSESGNKNDEETSNNNNQNNNNNNNNNHSLKQQQERMMRKKKKKKKMKAQTNKNQEEKNDINRSSDDVIGEEMEEMEDGEADVTWMKNTASYEECCKTKNTVEGLRNRNRNRNRKGKIENVIQKIIDRLKANLSKNREKNMSRCCSKRALRVIQQRMIEEDEDSEDDNENNSEKEEDITVNNRLDIDSKNGILQDDWKDHRSDPDHVYVDQCSSNIDSDSTEDDDMDYMSHIEENNGKDENGNHRALAMLRKNSISKCQNVDRNNNSSMKIERDSSEHQEQQQQDEDQFGWEIFARHRYALESQLDSVLGRLETARAMSKAQER